MCVCVYVCAVCVYVCAVCALEQDNPSNTHTPSTYGCRWSRSTYVPWTRSSPHSSLRSPHFLAPPLQRQTHAHCAAHNTKQNMHLHAHTHTHTHMHDTGHTHTRTHTHTIQDTHTHTHTHARPHIHTHARTHTHTHDTRHIHTSSVIICTSHRHTCTD